MAEIKKISILAKYKNIFGDAKNTIQSIQSFIDKKPETKQINNTEEEPASSINRILNSTVCEDTSNDIQKIINNM